MLVIKTSHVSDLNLQITNKFFNTIHKDAKNSFDFINYLFIIEYGGLLSKNEVSDLYIKHGTTHTLLN